MNLPDQFEPPFRLGAWLVQPALNRITGPQGQVQVEPRVMQVLLNLAGRPGEVVTRTRLLDEVWGDQVVGEENLTRAVSELRRIFQDQARQPAVIETIRHHGYRLIAPLQREAPLPPPAPPPAPPPSVVPSAQAPSPSAAPSASAAAGMAGHRTARLRVLVPAAALAAIALLVLWSLDRGRDRPPGPPDDPRTSAGDLVSRVVPLTSYPGRERHPALSADGTRVAFAWSGPPQTGIRGDTYIFVKQRNAETALQLTAQPGWAAWPAWSPDGQTVAYVQGRADSTTICTVPALGGPVRPLHAAGSLVEGLDWSPDGTQLVFAAVPAGGARFALFTLDLDSLTVRLLGDRRDPGAGSARPRFSPDGRRLAWIGSDPVGEFGLYVGDPHHGPTQVVAQGLGDITGLAWSRDGSALVYAAAPAGLSQLWSVPVAGGRPALLPTGDDLAWNPAVARGSGDLAFEQVRVDQDLWRIGVKGQDPWRLESGPFAPSTRWEYGADFHPDGRQVVLVSARSGAPELWTCDLAGLNLQQLTELAPAAITNPRWSPASDRIACNVVRNGRSVVAVLDPRGGPPRFLEPGLQRAVFCAWTADGKGLLVSAEQDKAVRLFRLDPDSGLPAGGTAPSALLELEAQTGAESPDGRHLYFTRPDRPGLWRLPAPYRQTPPQTPELVLADLQDRDRGNWRLLEGRVAWVMRAAGAAILAFSDLATGRTSLVADLPGLSGPGLAVSPDGMTLLYARTGDVAADLMLIERFQPPE